MAMKSGRRKTGKRKTKMKANERRRATLFPPRFKASGVRVTEWTLTHSEEH